MYNAGRRCVHLCTLSCSGPQTSAAAAAAAADPAHLSLPTLPTTGNTNLDGPIYIDLTAPTTMPDGKKVWQVKNVYYVSLGGGSEWWQGAVKAGRRRCRIMDPK